MATKPAKEVATKQDQVPAYIKKGQGRGSENVGSQDVQLPRIDVLQALSPQIKKSNDEYIEGAEQGVIFNTLTGELYPNGVNVVPVYFSKQYLVWKDRDAGGGLAGVFDTMAEAEAKAEEDKLFEAVETPTHIVMVVDDDGNPVGEASIPMSRSKYKVSRKFNSLVRLNGGDRFSRVYHIRAVEDEGPKGEYWNIAIRDAGYPTEAAYKEAEKLYEAIHSGRVNVNTDYSNTDSPEEASEY